jgi:putative Mg2+ transporter-C (MgtC) family protein
MIVSAFGFADILGTKNVILDPSRIAAQVVSGIGFLGAGSILLRGDVVRGLTTAASLWTVAAVGLAVGGGLYLEATAATFIILVILAGIKPLEEWYKRRSQTHEIYLRANYGKMSIDVLNQALGYRARRITRYISSRAEDAEFDDITLTITRLSAIDTAEIVEKLRALPDVREAEER